MVHTHSLTKTRHLTDDTWVEQQIRSYDYVSYFAQCRANMMLSPLQPKNQQRRKPVENAVYVYGQKSWLMDRTRFDVNVAGRVCQSEAPAAAAAAAEGSDEDDDDCTGFNPW